MSVSKTDNFDDFQEFEDDFSSQYNSFTPQNLNDGSTFKTRNDPAELLERFKLQLLNAYKVVIREKDETGKTITKIKLKRIKGTEPIANKQGVSDIFAYWEKFLNGHLVQTNFESMEDLNHIFHPIADTIVKDFLAMRKEWGVSHPQIDLLISNTKYVFYIFLRRGLRNEERRGYGEVYKETTERKTGYQEKENVFQKVGSYMLGKGGIGR